MSDTRSRTHDFFRETVEPTVEEFLADRRNIRRGRLASIVLSHMVDYWCVDYNERKLNQKRNKFASEIRKELASKTPIDNYSFSQAVWDVCDASKHAILTQQNHVLKDAKDVKQNRVGAMGTVPFGMAPMGALIPNDVIVVLDNGKRYSLSCAVSRVMDVWRQMLGQ